MQECSGGISNVPHNLRAALFSHQSRMCDCLNGLSHSTKSLRKVMKRGMIIYVMRILFCKPGINLTLCKSHTPGIEALWTGRKRGKKRKKDEASNLWFEWDFNMICQ